MFFFWFLSDKKEGLVYMREGNAIEQAVFSFRRKEPKAVSRHLQAPHILKAPKRYSPPPLCSLTYGAQSYGGQEVRPGFGFAWPIRCRNPIFRMVAGISVNYLKKIFHYIFIMFDIKTWIFLCRFTVG
jgi:hypothetical protein